MKRILTLSIFPVIGLLLIAAAYLWSERELRLRFQGEPADGLIIGMVLQRSDYADILAALDTRLDLKLANGDRIEVEFRNFAAVSGSYHASANGNARQLSPAELSPGPTAADAPLSFELRQAVESTARGDAEKIRWALQRESRRTDDPKRVVRVEKTETVHGYFKMTSVPLVMALRDGKINFESAVADAPQAGIASIHAVFDLSDPAAVNATNGDSMSSYEYTINGEAHTPAKKDFYLAAEPYVTEFLPIFAFEANGISVARLSHIGRHGGPTLALRLFAKCKVYYDPQQPTEAVLIADAGNIDDDWLSWFSRYCEGLFGQWGSGTLITLAGCMFLGAGLINISLAIKPSKAIPSPI